MRFGDCERCEAAPLAGENVTLAGGISARLCMPCRRAWNVHAWDAYEALCVEEAALVAEQRGISHDDSIRLETREQRVRAAALRVVDAKRDLRDMALDWLTPATD